MCHPIPNTSQQQKQCTAKTLDSSQRQQVAIRTLAGERVSTVANELNVSRKFVHQQKAKAQQGLDEVFAPTQPDDAVLFNLPVTKKWLYQLILGLVLVCRSSLRGVIELLSCLFDFRISLGSVHSILDRAVEKAREHNMQQDLSQVRIGAHDEIFQNNRPVLTGVDVDSTYCYLLSLEDHRDGDTWGVRLLELKDRGLAPEATITDGGKGMRKGQQEALPGVPQRGDVFHALKDVTGLVSYLDNRAYRAIAACDKLRHKQAKGKAQEGDLEKAQAEEAQAIKLADDVRILAKWLQQDIFAVAGPAYEERCALCDYVVAELQGRQHCSHRIGPVATMLKNQRDCLLAFAAELDRDLKVLAEEFEVAETVVRQMLEVQAMDAKQPARWRREAQLREQLRGRYYHLSEVVAEVRQRTVRASSVVENYNGRLRNYFFLRRHLGPEYLHLLQFFLNHRRFMRSERPDRVGKSPAELLTGQEHSHWLQLLGYELFSRN
jgi:hypothetical protein